MGLIGAVLLFFLFILVYVMIAEIFTVLFRLTGLTEEKAKFQVISMLTNSGYTTQESEVIATSKIRRKLAQITMVFGYAFTVTIVSSVVNIFLALKKTQIQHVIWIIGILCFFVIILYIFQKSHWLKKSFDKRIERIGNRIMFGKRSNPVVILDNYEGVVMAEVYLTNIPKFLESAMLKETDLKQRYNVIILLIKRDEGLIEKINGEIRLKKNDTLVVFGERKNIRAVFEKVEDKIEG
ncbi:cation:proton antiporter regulatory subunit [Anaerovorax sp. IOR16]|uniref:cation:proton antiporter regulatory subunit n=1 Tax=Anaerovorax sp. IOR16 TaxID=2773458 RepID=UPI0019CFF309|nr:TrkA C-terminal domain-containing protein [Anaerovorax sp. IOR16]